MSVSDWVNRCYFGDCREGMRQMIADGVKVQTVCSSPPYWGLRDYGTATWEGGDAECDHRKDIKSSTEHIKQDGYKDAFRNQSSRSNHAEEPSYLHECGKCGARRIDKQIGLEATPDEYVANMVGVFRLVRDLLADDGVIFVNLGDSYQDKQLVGVPWRVAFALQADGWYLRQDIIWAKPNPMPESVTDRCTKAHEYIFLMSKRDRYYFDAAAIAERAEAVGRVPGGNHKVDASRNDAGRDMSIPTAETRNRRSVWTIATQPYSEAHFATFPPKLIEPCILAGTSQRGHCPQCGKRWVRVTERASPPDVEARDKRMPDTGYERTRKVGQAYQNWLNENPKQTIGWQPSCICGLDPVPDIVFDPFMGSGTTGQVAQDLGRQWLGCELQEEYGKMQQARTSQQGLVLA